MKKVIFCFIILNVALLMSGQEGWKRFTSKEAGFSIKYPADLAVTVGYAADSDGDGEAEGKTLLESGPEESLIELSIFIDEIESIGDYPCGYSKEHALEEKALLNEGKAGGALDWSRNVKLRKVDTLYGETFFIYARFAADMLYLERGLLFFHNNYRIVVFSKANRLNAKLAWNDGSKGYMELLEILDGGEAPGEIQRWYDRFYEIIDTIKIIDNKYFQTTVKNLRLRKGSNLKSGIVRNLALKEELLFVDRLHSETTIDGVKGYWVKVKTGKGEVGWCFSGYLEEFALIRETNKREKQ